MPGRDTAFKLMLQLKFLPSRQVNVRHHPPGAAPADSFKNRQRGFHNLREFLDRIPLIRTQGNAGGCGNDESAAAFSGLDLKNIPDEAIELLQVDADQLTAGRLQAVQNTLALV